MSLKQGKYTLQFEGGPVSQNTPEPHYLPALFSSG